MAGWGVVASCKSLQRQNARWSSLDNTPIVVQLVVDVTSTDCNLTKAAISMIVAGVAWHLLVRFFRSRQYACSELGQNQHFHLHLFLKAAWQREGARGNFAYVPVRVYHKVCFNLLMDSNAFQFVRRADDFVKFVRKQSTLPYRYYSQVRTNENGALHLHEVFSSSSKIWSAICSYSFATRQLPTRPRQAQECSRNLRSSWNSFPCVVAAICQRVKTRGAVNMYSSTIEERGYIWLDPNAKTHRVARTHGSIKPVGIRPSMAAGDCPRRSRELRAYYLFYCIHDYINITIHGEIACIVHVHKLELTCKSEDTQN